MQWNKRDRTTCSSAEKSKSRVSGSKSSVLYFSKFSVINEEKFRLRGVKESRDWQSSTKRYVQVDFVSNGRIIVRGIERVEKLSVRFRLRDEMTELR